MPHVRNSWSQAQTELSDWHWACAVMSSHFVTQIKLVGSHLHAPSLLHVVFFVLRTEHPPTHDPSTHSQTLFARQASTVPVREQVPTHVPVFPSHAHCGSALQGAAVVQRYWQRLKHLSTEYWHIGEPLQSTEFWFSALQASVQRCVVGLYWQVEIAVHA